MQRSKLLYISVGSLVVIFFFIVAGLDRAVPAVFLSAFVKNHASLSPTTLEFRSATIPFLISHEHRLGDSLLSHSETSVTKFRAREDFWIIEADGGELKNAPLGILHHATLVVGDEKSGNCFNKVVDVRSARIQGLSKKYPSGFGQFIKKDTPLELHLLFHNNTGKDYRDVSFSLRFKVVSGNSSLLRPVYIDFITLSDDPCKLYFSVPPEMYNFTAQSSERIPNSSVTFEQDGDILMLHPHYHVDDGGKALTMFLNGKKVYELIPLEYRIPNSTIPLLPLIKGAPSIMSVKKGDTITISTTYDNPRETSIVDAMAQLWIYFSPLIDKP